ncbi:MAG TPA: transketolase, partial [Prolixibacteraceae bacterium]
MSNSLTNRAADNIRILSAAMVEKANSGHPGGAMGGADFVNILFSEFLKYDPSEMTWPFRDRFFLDPGHMSPMLYSVLALAGNYSIDDLKGFRQWGSVTPGHPEVDPERGVENTSGPLGQGHTMAVGAAIAERFLVARFGEWMAHKTYTFISDGGVQEEISQGAGRLAGYLGLNNLIMFYDSNDIQLSTETKAVTAEDTEMKYKAWGWNVMTIAGNDADAIRGALRAALTEKHKPTIIIGKTIMGKGALKEDGSSFERQCSTHGQPLTHAGASFKKTIANLGGDPERPFVIFPEVAELYAKRSEELKAWANEKNDEEDAWAAANPELADKLDRFLSGDVPEFDFSKIVQKAGAATRNASATVLAAFAKEIDNMIVSSADLSNSDKTDGFLNNTHAFKSGDFTGAFLQA